MKSILEWNRLWSLLRRFRGVKSLLTETPHGRCALLPTHKKEGERERERGKPSNTHHLVLIFSAHHNFSFSKEHPAGMERSGESGVAALLELLRAPPRVFAS